MCLAIPVKVVEVKKDRVVVDADGIRKEAGIMLLPDVKIGDYVLLHSGFVIRKIDSEDAKETLELIKEIVENDKK